MVTSISHLHDLFVRFIEKQDKIDKSQSETNAPIVGEYRYILQNGLRTGTGERWLLCDGRLVAIIEYYMLYEQMYAMGVAGAVFYTRADMADPANSNLYFKLPNLVGGIAGCPQDPTAFELGTAAFPPSQNVAKTGDRSGIDIIEIGNMYIYSGPNSGL